MRFSRHKQRQLCFFFCVVPIVDPMLDRTHRLAPDGTAAHGSTQLRPLSVLSGTTENKRNARLLAALYARVGLCAKSALRLEGNDDETQHNTTASFSALSPFFVMSE